jgi:hypothetical protein
MLLMPVVLLASANDPFAVLPKPLVLLKSAAAPVAVFPSAVLNKSVPAPTPVFKSPVLTVASESHCYLHGRGVSDKSRTCVEIKLRSNASQRRNELTLPWFNREAESVAT